MVSGSLKGISAAVVVAVAYINDTLSPLFWVLLALVAVDLLLNLHDFSKQKDKLISAAVGLGLPSALIHATNTPHFASAIVATLTLAYLQVVWPQINAAIARLKLSGSKAIDHAEVEAIQLRLDSVKKHLTEQAKKEGFHT